jgi:phosphotriesterase-related protein
MNQRETRQQAGYVLRQVERGHLDRILLSHDTAKTEHRKFSGGTGYTYIPTGFAELLRGHGMTAEDVDTMLVDNPRRMLTGG